MPSPNVTLWYKDSSELKANEKKQVQEKLSALYLLKNRYKLTKVSCSIKGRTYSPETALVPYEFMRWHQRNLHSKPY